MIQDWYQITKMIIPVFWMDLLMRGGRSRIKPVAGMEYLYYKKVRKRSYLSKSFQNKFKNHILQEREKDSSFVWNMFEHFYKECKELEETSKRIYETELSSKSLEELKELLEQFDEKATGMTPSLYLPFVIEPVTEDLIKEELEKIDKEISDEYFLVLTAPIKETRTGKAQKEILRLAIELENKKGLFKKDTKDIKYELETFDHDIFRKIADYVEKYKWLEIRYGYGEELTVDSVIKRLKNILEKDPKEQLRKIEEHRKEIEEKTKIIIKELNLGENFQDAVETAKENVYIRTYRLESYSKSCFYTKPLLKEIAKRLKTSYEGLILLTKDEILNEKDVYDKIKDREKEFAIALEDGNITLYTGEDIKKVDVAQEEIKTDEIKGYGACKGIVKGPVKKIGNKFDIHKIIRGDILVAEFTTPDFVPAMEKALAIVTDIGGITSHTAIVSRELGIPCVIGTKIATKVLQDGDLVEVNADKGIVRKIE
jgi:phosphohistidine swiveling domain-containing protein